MSYGDVMAIMQFGAAIEHVFETYHAIRNRKEGRKEESNVTRIS